MAPNIHRNVDGEVAALLYVTHITVRDKVRVVKVVRGNSSKRVKGIEIWLMSILKIF